jgi:histidinol dehydrogenase
MTLKVLDLDQASDTEALEGLIDRLRAQAAPSGEVAETVARILEDVGRRGDEAVVDYMRQWTDPAFSADRIAVEPDELSAAGAGLDPAVREALEQAIEHVRAYQRHILPTDPPPLELDGAQLGLRFTPMQRVGMAVPGGRAAYPSTVIMTVAPAQVAGVEEIAVVCPPPTRQGDDAAATDVSPLVLGVCDLLGVAEVYRIGGAQAMAALALGTETIQPVDFIAGPGNAFVQQAKRQLFGTVGIDGFYGPSEVVILADETADPELIAADLLAQAEHDPGVCFLVSTSRAVLDHVNAALEQQLPECRRQAAIRPALEQGSAAVLCPSRHAAVGVVDTLAAEHVTLAVADPAATLAQLRHGGAWFLGDRTPVASGDYYAGPSHCLPTGTTARFTSGISVYTFLKRSSVEHYPNGPTAAAVEHIATLAEAEGLDAHARSARLRR